MCSIDTVALNVGPLASATSIDNSMSSNPQRAAFHIPRYESDKEHECNICHEWFDARGFPGHYKACQEEAAEVSHYEHLKQEEERKKMEKRAGMFSSYLLYTSITHMYCT